MAGKRFFFFLFLFITCKNASSQDDCDLKKSQDSIFVYTCKSPDLALKSIKATFSIHTTPAVFVSFMMDATNFPKWQYNTIESRVLKKISETDMIYCSEIEAPWPVSNRDMVMHLKITQDPLTKTMVVDLKSMPDFIPEKPDVVRMPRAEGQWVITPTGKNELHVTYTFLVDPGGSVPVWLINMALANGPYETFRNLKAKIKTE